MTECSCDVCGRRKTYRVGKTSPHDADVTQPAPLYPYGWGREFCAQKPDDPKKNRILCEDCLATEKVQRGTVRFIAMR